MMHATISAFLLGALMTVSLSAPAADVTISCGAVGQEKEFCEQAVNAWARETGNRVTVTTPPERTNERYFKYLVDLGAGDSRTDVYQIDVIWPGLLAKHFVDLRQYLKPEDIRQHHPAILASNTVDGRLVGMPWFTDVGVLYYRKDLLEKYGLPVPQDWSELADVALYIQTQERQAGQAELWGYVFQGAAYEGLTCNALEWIASYNGGTIVEPDGKISINNPQAVKALAQAKPWVNTITPPGVLNYTEEESRGVFQAGNALFMSNWPYAWGLSQGADSPVRGKVGTAPLPKGGDDGRHAATLGGWQMAVSKYSANQDAAIALVLYLTGPEVQKKRAVELSQLPTLVKLYEDPEVVKANPFFAEMKDILAGAVARPATVTGAKYNQVSSEFFNAVYAVLSGGKSAEQSLADLEGSLKRMSRGGKW